MAVKFINSQEAVDLIKDGSTITTNGFVGAAFAEEIASKIEENYLKTNHPNNLTLYYAAGQGNGKDSAINRLAHKGLLKRVVGGHMNLDPKIQQLSIDGDIEAYNFPQGIVSHMYRDRACKKPYTYSKVGLKTFVDPDNDGGKLNDITKEDLVFKNKINGEDYLFYKLPDFDVAILRGTYADEYGNISCEQEGAYLDITSIANATKASGGIVIVQVKDIVSKSSLDPRFVKLSGAMVDYVVKTSDPEKYHQQVFGEAYNPSFSGETKAVLSAEKPYPFNIRKVIARRAAQLLKPSSIVNLGIGIPEIVASVVNEEGQGEEMTLSLESGLTGGVPQGGPAFGMSANPYMIVDQDRQFDFYDGGGLDITYLGLAQCDQYGNINVSRFGSRIAGCGGFINISQSTKKVVFCGTFTAGGLKEEIIDGKIVIKNEGKIKKFIKNVEQITFSAEFANETGQEITYITERAVLILTKDGLKLVEIAPGIDLQKDILDQMEFKPIISDNLKQMDPALFREEKIGLNVKKNIDEYFDIDK